MTLIASSLGPAIFEELKQKEDSYTVVVNPGPNEMRRVDGACMLYQLAMLVAVETRATVSSLLKQLSGPALMDLMGECDSDIKEFNKRVNVAIVALRARRATVPDLLPPLFEAYRSCEDASFADYFKRKEEQYEDRSLNVTVAVLMTSAQEKFKISSDKKQWKKKTSQQLEFIAMRAERTAWRNERAEINKLVQKPKKEPKAKTAKKAGPVNDGAWAWKNDAPKAGEPTTRTFRGKSYMHCPHHGDTKWVLTINPKGVPHATGCRALLKSSGDTASTSSSTKASKNETYKQALVSLLEDEQDVSMMTEDELIDPDEE